MTEQPDIDSLFLQPWWWDAVCDPNKQEILRLENAQGQTEGLWRMARVKRQGLFQVHAMPPLTQHAGPWLQKREDFLRFLTMIPEDWQLNLNLEFALTDSEIAFAQSKGMQVRPRQTHRLEDLSDMYAVYAKVKPAQQRQLKKAQKLLSPCAVNIENLIDLQKETFARQGLRCPYPPHIVRQLHQAVTEHGAGQLIGLADDEGRVMACGLFVYDTTTCYSLTHGFHKTARNLGAGSLLQWEGIKIAAAKHLIFDFEGSDIESIANFNSSFGAIAKPYTNLSRFSPLFRLIERLRGR